MWFPISTITAQLQNGVWVATDGPYTENRELEWITLIGPQSSSVNVYMDSTFLDTTARGDFNRADYYNGIPVARGRQVILYWNVGTGTAPTVSLAYSDGNTQSSAFAY